MSNDKLEIKATLVICRPSEGVFEAIINPEIMCNYFISKSSGPMVEGKTLIWQFPEMDMEFPVHIKRVNASDPSGKKYISFSWEDFRDGAETLVEITLTPKEKATMVTVTEKEKDNNEAGIQWLKSNTEGWANFLACMKAYLEYGIHLRKGAFDPSQMPV